MKQSTEDKLLQRKIFEMQCEICKALANPLRMAIVNRLDDREMAASALISALGISKANLSKHMTLLVQAGIAECRREGRQAFYRLVDPDIRKACAIMSTVLYRRLKRGEKLASVLSVAKA